MSQSVIFRLALPLTLSLMFSACAGTTLAGGEDVALEDANTEAISLVPSVAQPTKSYVAMGHANVALYVAELSGATQADKRISRVVATLSAKNPLVGPTKDAFTNYRLDVNGTTYIPQLTNVELAADGTTRVILDSPTSLDPYQLFVLPKNNSVEVKLIADAGSRQALAPFHTELGNVEARVLRLDIEYTNTDETHRATMSKTVEATTYNLMQSTIDDVFATDSLPGTEYSTKVIGEKTTLAGYGFVASVEGPSPTLNSVGFVWKIHGVKAANLMMPYQIYASTKNGVELVGSGNVATLAKAPGSTDYEGVFISEVTKPGAAPSDQGFTIPESGEFIRSTRLYVVFNTKKAFTPAGNGPMNFQVNLLTWAWNDGARGTRVPLQADPHYTTAPIIGHSITE